MTRVVVTQSIIDKAVKNRGSVDFCLVGDCPVAAAIREATGIAVNVGYRSIHEKIATVGPPNSTIRIDLPPCVSKAVFDFDAGDPLYPFGFEFEFAEAEE